LAKATEGGRPVRVFGEMVALLWDDGALAAAIELEKLWNDLAQRHSFSLFCAYPEQSVAPTGRRGALHDVCSHHTLVIQGETVDPAVTVHGLRSRRFDARVTSPREARHFIAETLTAWGRAELVDDASLIVSEFATNAVLHARSAFWVSASQIDRTVRLVVEDESQAPPAARSYGPEAATGRGLRLVDALADKWGVDLRTSGKAVWADLTS
jgi:anti-sigma regulatory factor (Ser/Thr protein kinase)